MNRRLFFAMLTLVSVLLLGAAVAAAQEPAPIPDPKDNISLAGAVANKISYQGRVTDANGNPLNGTTNLVFQLWDNATAGSQVGSNITKNNVPVNDGLFTVELDVPQNAFDGSGRWLRIQVNGEWLAPRQALLAVPYAMSLKPGAVMVGQNGQVVLKMKAAGGNDIFTVNEDGRVFIESDSTVGHRAGAAVFVNRTGPGAGVGIWAQTQGNAQPLVVENTTGWGNLIEGFGNDGGSDAEFVVKNDGRVVIDSHTDGTHRDGAAIFVKRTNPGAGGVGIWAQAQGNAQPLVVENTTGWGNLIEGFGNDGGSDAEFVVKNDGRVVIDSHTDGTHRDGAAIFVKRTNPGTGGVGIWAQTQGDGTPLVVENTTGSGTLIEGFGNDGGNADFVVHNNGQVDATILRIAGGSDLAEQFEIRGTETDSRPTPGMVVSIDPENPGELLVSAEAYDKKVAGIISGAGGIQPGMLMGQTGTTADGEYPVALTGRVYVQADASASPIQPGDLLTTSDLPGHAMKVTDHNWAQGAILGKAMTGLDDGQDLVLVLVSLQ